LRTTSLGSERSELLKRNLNSERLLSLVVRYSRDEPLSTATVCGSLSNGGSLRYFDSEIFHDVTSLKTSLG